MKKNILTKVIIGILISSVVYTQCLGDLNQDNDINVLDIILLVNTILEDGESNEVSDLNSDNILNILDIISLVNITMNNSNPCEVTWGEETSSLPDYYYTSSIPSNQLHRIKTYFDIAASEWGNFGPLEFWIVGTDPLEAEHLDELYCEMRLEKDSCLDNNFLQWCLNREYSFVDYANNGGAGLSLSRDFNWNCEGYSYLEITLSSQYPFPNETDYDVVTMHEYFHAYQQSHIATYDYEERASMMVVNPWWSEGGAEYMAQLLYSDQPGISDDYLQQRMTWKMQSKNDLLQNELISEIPYGQRAYIAYDLGAWAIAYLISMVELDIYVNDFYNDLNQYGWEESFNRNFNMSSSDFLINFHNFLNLDIEEQLIIIP
tara:strand:+ start:3937 stop:5061 length:1125 start_codon:yes stop_codon:yes gene_type:complete